MLNEEAIRLIARRRSLFFLFVQRSHRLLALQICFQIIYLAKNLFTLLVRSKSVSHLSPVHSSSPFFASIFRHFVNPLAFLNDPIDSIDLFDLIRQLIDASDEW